MRFNAGMRVWWRVATMIVLLAVSACQRAPERSSAEAATPTVDMETRLRLGETAYEARDWSAAEPHYVALTREFPAQADLWFRLANIYARTDQPDLAIRAYRETLVRKPDFAKAWFNMGVVQLRQAANSFHKMEVHVAAGDPSRAQATMAYQRIQEILEDGTPAEQAQEPVNATTAMPVLPITPDDVGESPAATPRAPSGDDASDESSDAP